MISLLGIYGKRSVAHPAISKNFAKRSLPFEEGKYLVKELSSTIEKKQAYRLRHRIFHEELNWVPGKINRLEVDSNDCNAISLGVLNQENRLLGYLRILMADSPFMIENELSAILGEGKKRVKKNRERAEISRLCVSPQARDRIIEGNFGTHAISLLLYKGVYRWCLEKGIRYIYLVVEYKILRLLRAKGFPCVLMAKPKVMADGVEAVAAVLDWRKFEELNLKKRPDLLQWFTQYQSFRPVMETCSAPSEAWRFLLGESPSREWRESVQGLANHPYRVLRICRRCYS